VSVCVCVCACEMERARERQSESQPVWNVRPPRTHVERPFERGTVGLPGAGTAWKHLNSIAEPLNLFWLSLGRKPSTATYA